jgi:hypothetical protein
MDGDFYRCNKCGEISQVPHFVKKHHCMGRYDTAVKAEIR